MSVTVYDGRIEAFPVGQRQWGVRVMFPVFDVAGDGAVMVRSNWKQCHRVSEGLPAEAPVASYC